jgi:hypothetical protein
MLYLVKIFLVVDMMRVIVQQKTKMGTWFFAVSVAENDCQKTQILAYVANVRIVGCICTISTTIILWTIENDPFPVSCH